MSLGEERPGLPPWSPGDMFSWLDTFLRFFCPCPCRGCGAVAGPLCPTCLLELSGPLIRVPGRPGQPAGVAVGPFQGLLRHLLHASKFPGDPPTSHALATWSAPRLAAQRDWLGAPQALVFPPVAPSRRCAHPAPALARALGQVLSLPVLEDLVVRAEEDLGPTHRLPARARPTHLARSLRGGRPAPAGISRVLLVDDTVTTGSTLRRMTELLAYRGLRVTAWVALARTPRKDRLSRPGGTDLSRRKENADSCLRANLPRSAPGVPPSLDDPASSW